jgi:Xaa-Pro aminopeptidase
MSELIPAAPDITRMRVERATKLHDALAARDVSAVVLLGTTNVRWATGARVVAADQGRSAHFRNVAVALNGDPVPHLFTHHPDGVAPGFPADHVHGGLDMECDAGARTLLDFVVDVTRGARDGRVLLDEWSMALRREWTALLPDAAPDDGALSLMGELKLYKTSDELACIRTAQWINERAMLDVQAALRPGMRCVDLSGFFLRRVFELGAHQNTVDPIWQVMPPSLADGPRSVTGDLVFPTVTTARALERGDVVWVDTGITWEGYDSDFGRTWIVGNDPSPAQHDQHRQWRQVMDAVLDAVRPGATGGDLTRAALGAASGGRKPWLSHLYLAHGIGVDSAEAPFIGTDLGPGFDEGIVLAPGMVFVLEPVAWRDGTGGYRAEEIVAVTADGHRLLSDHPYEPYAA